MKEALFYKKSGNSRVRCLLCPYNCVLANKEYGICRVRRNIDGRLFTENYEEVTSVAVDPTEKKPLYHFYPGCSILSFGTFGCNLKCPFCQNWEISRERPATQKISVSAIAEMCERKGINLVAFTYNEPSIWYEFVYDTAKYLHKLNIKSVLVTNGFINKEPLGELVNYISAANIDLKSITEDFYTKFVGGGLQPVLDTIKFMFNSDIHIELTTLIIPGRTDSEKEMDIEARWIRDNLNEQVPLHLSRYFPQYKLNSPSTDVKKMIKLYNVAKNYLKFVYLGNVWTEKYNSTFCPNCGNLLISRSGYSTNIAGLTGDSCNKCNCKINVIS